jgi:hypothetical protein
MIHRDVDRSSNSPYSAALCTEINSGNCIAQLWQSFTVPTIASTGVPVKRFVIEYILGDCQLDAIVPLFLRMSRGEPPSVLARYRPGRMRRLAQVAKSTSAATGLPNNANCALRRPRTLPAVQIRAVR